MSSSPRRLAKLSALGLLLSSTPSVFPRRSVKRATLATFAAEVCALPSGLNTIKVITPSWQESEIDNAATIVDTAECVKASSRRHGQSIDSAKAHRLVSRNSRHCQERERLDELDLRNRQLFCLRYSSRWLGGYFLCPRIT